MVKWDYQKRAEKGVPHICQLLGGLGYLKVYCDVRKSWFLAWNQKRHNMYYILHIQCTNSEISIGLFYIRAHFVWWHQLNQCAALVRHLPASILVRASVSLRSTILAPFWFTNFEWDLSSVAEHIIVPFHFHAVERSCWTTLKTLSSSLKKKHL